MKINLEKVANCFLEIASEQRLNILFNLRDKNLTITEMAKTLSATVPEVHRNFSRLSSFGLIVKNSDGSYSLTEFGKIVCINAPTFSFMIKNISYFEKHTFGNIPNKFLMRLSELESVQVIKGFVKVLEQWKEIHYNSEQFIYNILYEVPYSLDLIEIVSKKLEKNVKILSIFSEDAIIPKERKKSFEKFQFKKYVQSGTLERKMMKNVNVVVLLNEKEACLILPNKNGDVDMGEMLYSKENSFHEWCEDYFNSCWNNANSFQEIKIKD